MTVNYFIQNTNLCPKSLSLYMTEQTELWEYKKQPGRKGEVLALKKFTCMSLACFVHPLFLYPSI